MRTPTVALQVCCILCASIGRSKRELTRDVWPRYGAQLRANASAIRDQAVASGMRLLREDGLAKIASGLTTPGEVARVTVRAAM
jgi:type II secretory ATPase GspE/PulE/Tfp pilus assembly ATPase PilB-like protein